MYAAYSTALVHGALKLLAPAEVDKNSDARAVIVRTQPAYNTLDHCCAAAQNALQRHALARVRP